MKTKKATRPWITISSSAGLQREDVVPLAGPSIKVGHACLQFTWFVVWFRSNKQKYMIHHVYTSYTCVLEMATIKFQVELFSQGTVFNKT